MLKRVLIRLWGDERGVVHSTDVILVTTILGLGVLVGIVSLRNQVVQEFCDIGGAVGALNQSYSYEGRTDAQQRDYFNNLPDPPTPLDWLGVHEAAGSDYTDNPNVDGTIDFPSSATPNTTPGED
jgi:hypothetical protein